MTYRELYREGVRILKSVDIFDCEYDARILLEHVCKTDRNYLFVHGKESVDSRQEQEYRALLDKRKQHIPLQHLTGQQGFMGLEFRVDRHVLIPRPDTEILVEEVLKELHDGMRILDMCTGSGCILISLIKYSNGCCGVGADISKEALKVAAVNAADILSDKCQNFGIQPSDAAAFQNIEFSEDYSSVVFVNSDLYSNIFGKYEIIVSNPPYIKKSVIPTLMPEVRDHDPMLALDGGDEGLDFYRIIVAEGINYLCGGGKLFLEIGHDQAADVSALMKDAGYTDINVVKDYAGHDRVVYGTYIN